MPSFAAPPVSQAALRGLFDRISADYDRHAALERAVADRLLERAAFRRREPARILDLGCGTGYCAAALKRRHRKAEVIALDFSLGMCQRASERSRWFRPLHVVCAEFDRLPVADRAVDLLVANLAFQWSREDGPVFRELRRAIRPGGMLLFSCLGPGSMRQLVESSATALPGAVFRPFPDMHDVGDALVAAGFDDPVMDSEALVLAYRCLGDLLGELEATGASSHAGDWTAVRAAAEDLAVVWPRGAAEAAFPLTWEVVYGTAFGPAEGRPVRTGAGEVATFSVDELRRAPRRR